MDYSYYNNNKSPATKQPPKAKKLSISILVVSLPLLYVYLLHVPPSSLLTDTAFWFLIANSIIFIAAADFASSSSTENTTATNLYDEYVKHARTRSTKEEFEKPAPDSTPVQMQVQQPEPAADNADPKQSSEEPELGAETHAFGSSGELKLLHDENINVANDSSSTELRSEPELVPAVVDVKQPRLCERRRSELFETNGEATKSSVLPRSATSVTEKRRRCGVVEESDYWKMSDEELNERVEEFIRRFNREIRLQEMRQASAVC